MNVDPIIAGAVVSAAFAIQAIIINKLLKLETRVAVMLATCHVVCKNKKQQTENEDENN